MSLKVINKNHLTEFQKKREKKNLHKHLLLIFLTLCLTFFKTLFEGCELLYLAINLKKPCILLIIYCFSNPPLLKGLCAVLCIFRPQT